MDHIGKIEDNEMNTPISPLKEKQLLFGSLVPKLLLFILESGYQYTFGETWRTPEMAELYAKAGKGIKNSAHCNRLAIDLNLHKDGEYLTKTDDHLPFGVFWEGLHPLCRWGGRFYDGNHYSVEHQGIK